MYGINFKSSSNTGFTLVEVIIALVILLGAILASMAYFYLGTERHVDALKHEYALQLGEDKIEEWRALPWLADIEYKSSVERFFRYGTRFKRYFTASSAPSGVDTHERYQVIITSVVWTVDEEEKKIKLRSIVHP